MTKYMFGATPAEKLAARQKKEGNCIVWTGAIRAGGYGAINIGGTMRRVHRIAWELENGSIPKGMVVDHVCNNRACFKVSHLRVVTKRQNNSRQEGKLNNPLGFRGVEKSGRGYAAKWRHEGHRYHKTLYSIPAAAVYVANQRLRCSPLPSESDAKMVELYGPIMLSNLPELEQPYAMSTGQNEEEFHNDQ